jgi:hypothetical protein
MFQKVTLKAECPKQAKQENLLRDAMVELRCTAEEQSSVHFQQVQYLEK